MSERALSDSDGPLASDSLDRCSCSFRSRAACRLRWKLISEWNWEWVFQMLEH